MVRHHRLNPEQEREAKLLEAKIRVAVDQEISHLARLLVSKSEGDLFGQTEFQVCDLVLRVGARAFEEHLREKKRLPRLVGSLSRLRAKRGLPRLSRTQAAQQYAAHSPKP